MEYTVGTCSLCSGPVIVESLLLKDAPKVCARCGAVEAVSFGPVIPMTPAVPSLPALTTRLIERA